MGIKRSTVRVLVLLGFLLGLPLLLVVDDEPEDTVSVRRGDGSELAQTPERDVSAAPRQATGPVNGVQREVAPQAGDLDVAAASGDGGSVSLSAPTTVSLPPPTSTTTTGPSSTSTTSTTSSTTTTEAPSTCCGEGSVGLLVNARSSFHPWLDQGAWQWMDDHYDGMIVYESYWDAHIGDVSGEYVYKDSMAIYVDTGRDQRSVDHPDWVLREADGTPVYIDFACGGGCPQYAADVGNVGYQDDFVAAIQVLVDRGYTGLMLDDVNLKWIFADQYGNTITPVNPRTQAPMTLAEWQESMATFLEAIRAEFPTLRIMHNVIWFADTPGQDNPFVDRQIAAADLLQLERGANDPNFPAGTGKYGLQTFFRYIDRANALGTDVVLLDEGTSSLALQEFNLAATLLVNSGGDLVSTENFDLIGPGDLWSGFTTDLGDALGPWRVEDGVLRRDFTRGVVLLNEPGNATATIDLGQPMVRIDGTVVNAVSLAGRSAAVLSIS